MPPDPPLGGDGVLGLPPFPLEPVELGGGTDPLRPMAEDAEPKSALVEAAAVTPEPAFVAEVVPATELAPAAPASAPTAPAASQDDARLRVGER